MRERPTGLAADRRLIFSSKTHTPPLYLVACHLHESKARMCSFNSIHILPDKLTESTSLNITSLAHLDNKNVYEHGSYPHGSSEIVLTFVYVRVFRCLLRANATVREQHMLPRQAQAKVEEEHRRIRTYTEGARIEAHRTCILIGLNIACRAFIGQKLFSPCPTGLFVLLPFWLPPLCFWFFVAHNARANVPVCLLLLVCCCLPPCCTKRASERAFVLGKGRVI